MSRSCAEGCRCRRHTAKGATYGSDRERFLRHAIINWNTGCWEWDAGVSTNGYGKFQLRDKTMGAHRYGYELWYGPVPEGMQVDHLCHVRHCVNPAHLEAVPPAVNYARRLRHCPSCTCKTVP